MTKYIIGCFISFLLFSTPLAFGQEVPDGYLEGGPSETFEMPSLDLQRSYYGTFEKESALKPTRPRTREATPLIEPIIKEVPTFAEVEAAKVKATAETAIEVSKKAEAAALEAKQVATETKIYSEQVRNDVNQAIDKTNQEIDKTNQAIDKNAQAIDEVNASNEKLVQENAKLRFEMEQKAQALEQKDQGLSDEMANLKKEVDKLTVKEAKTSFYTVQKGDFLIKIAGKKNIYGEGSAWKKIYQTNRDKIKNPNLIYPGQKLQIPMPDGAAPAEIKVKKPIVRVPKQTPVESEEPLVPVQQ